MTLDLLSPAAVTMIARLLFGSRWAALRWWPLVVVVLTPETKQVMLRAELAADLARNDLGSLAHEARARRVGKGEVLLYLQCDDEEGAGARFGVIDLRAELARCAS